MPTHGMPIDPAQDVSATDLLSLPYRPRWPRSYRPAMGLIGCGGITRHHLEVYRDAGQRVVALCDLDRHRAEQRRRQYFPEAKVYTDFREVLRRDDIEVLDVATHPADRLPIIEAALRAGKHVLSQKPFVTDLDVGQRLVDLADHHGVRLAVNQNGRWAPHFSYAREAVARGELGQVNSACLTVHWDHGWVKGTGFEQVKHLILFDYAIHWFDIVRCFLPRQSVRRVFAATARSVSQEVLPDLLAHVSLEFDRALATLVFYGDTRFGRQDRTILVGDRATLISVGPNEKVQEVSIHSAAGVVTPSLQGCWFPDGFAGTMGELLCSIEERRPSQIDARDNLQSLAICFAAVESAEVGAPRVPGDVRRLPGA